jgi:predicted dehydrogenase
MPVSVYADIRIVRPISQVDDYFELVLYYPALRVKVKSSYLVREPLAAFILHGSKGSFIKSRADVQEAALQAGTDPGSPDWGLESETEQGLLHVEKNGTVIRDRLPSERGNYMEFYNAVYEALRNNQALPVSPEDALRVVEIIQKAYQSSRERRVVDV